MNRINSLMKNKKITNIIFYLLVIIFSSLFILFFIPSAKQIYNERFFSKLDPEYTNKAKIIEIVEEYEGIDYYDDEAMFYIYLCEITEGKEEDIGKKIYVIQVIPDLQKSKYIPGSIGNLIYISKTSGVNTNDNYQIDWEFAGSSVSFDRTIVTIVLVIIFVLIIIVFSRFQGLNTILALVYSLLSIIIVFIPRILLGGNIYFWTFVIFLYVVGVTLSLVIGFNKKSLCALFGCLGGLFIIAILTFISKYLFSLTGNYDDTTYELDLILSDMYNVKLDLRSLIFAVITLGSMGALLDVSISLSSALNEVSLKGSTKKEIVTSGFSIGKDMIGTMTNTLILAYFGSSLALVLYTILQYTFQGVMRLEVITIEILQSLIGTIGMLVAIPITSLMAGIIYTKGSKVNSLEIEK